MLKRDRGEETVSIDIKGSHLFRFRQIFWNTAICLKWQWFHTNSEAILYLFHCIIFVLKKWRYLEIHELAFWMYVSLLFVPFSFKTFVAFNFYLKYWSRYASEWDPREPGHTKVKKNEQKVPFLNLPCSVQCELNHTVQIVLVDLCDTNDTYYGHICSKSEKVA